MRREIEKIDKKILTLIKNRLDLSSKIGAEKTSLDKPIFDPAREARLLASIKSLSEAEGIEPEKIIPIYREIISLCLSAQRKLVVSFLGPEATFTHEAAQKRFGSFVGLLPTHSIKEVFLAVEKGNADYGVVPVENSIEGAVSHTLDMLVESGLTICSQVMIPIHHNLLAASSSSDIKRIYSNPLVFGQCRLFLESKYPKADLIDVPSTAYAAQIAVKEKASAAIGSLLAAKKYKLKVLAKSIEDSSDNYTKFLVIGRKMPDKTGKDKTSIVFSVKDEVGALHQMLLPFKRNKINLTKIESRPSKKRAWDYYFFIDMEGHIKDKVVNEAIKELEKKCKFLKVLGSYPVD